MKQICKITTKTLLFSSIAIGSILSPILSSHFSVLLPNVSNDTFDQTETVKSPESEVDTLINGVHTNTLDELTVNFSPFLYLNYFNKSQGGLSPIASVDFSNKSNVDTNVYIANTQLFLAIKNDYDNSCILRESKNNSLLAINAPSEAANDKESLSAIVVLDLPKSEIVSNVIDFSAKEVKLSFDVVRMVSNESWHVEKTLTVSPEVTGGIIINNKNSDFFLTEDPTKNVMKNFGSISLMSHGLSSNEIKLNIISTNGADANELFNSKINSDMTFDLEWKGIVDFPTDLNFKFRIIATIGNGDTILPVFSDTFNLNVVNCLKKNVDKIVASDSHYDIQLGASNTIINNIATLYLNTKYYVGIEDDCFGSFVENTVMTGYTMKAMSNTTYSNMPVFFTKMPTDRYDISQYPESEWTVLSVNINAIPETTAPYFVGKDGYARFSLYVETPYSTFDGNGFNFKFITTNSSQFLGKLDKDNQQYFQLNKEQQNINEMTFYNSINSGGYNTSLEDDRTAYKNYYVVDAETNKRLSGWTVEDKLQSLLTKKTKELSGWSKWYSVPTPQKQNAEFNAFYFSHINGDVKREIAPYAYTWNLVYEAFIAITAITAASFISGLITSAIAMGITGAQSIAAAAAADLTERVNAIVPEQAEALFKKLQNMRVKKQAIVEKYRAFSLVEQHQYEIQNMTRVNSKLSWYDPRMTRLIDEKILFSREDSAVVDAIRKSAKMYDDKIRNLRARLEVARADKINSLRADIKYYLDRKALEEKTFLKICSKYVPQYGPDSGADAFMSSIYDNFNENEFAPLVSKIEDSQRLINEYKLAYTNEITTETAKVNSEIKKLEPFIEEIEKKIPRTATVQFTEKGIVPTRSDLSEFKFGSPTKIANTQKAFWKTIKNNKLAIFFMAVVVAMSIFTVWSAGKTEGGVKTVTADDDLIHKEYDNTNVPNYSGRNLVIKSDKNAEVPLSKKVRIIADAYSDAGMSGMNNPDYASKTLELRNSVFKSDPIAIEIGEQQISDHDLSPATKENYSAVVEKELAPGLNKAAGSIYFHDAAQVTAKTDISAEICDLEGNKITEKGWGINVYGTGTNKRTFDLLLPSTVEQSNFIIKVYRKEFLSGVAIQTCKSNSQNTPINSAAYFSGKKQVSYNQSQNITDKAMSKQFLEPAGLKAGENPYKIFTCNQDTFIPDIVNFNSQIPFANGDLTAKVVDVSTKETLAKWITKTQTRDNKNFSFSLFPPKNFSGSKLIKIFIYNKEQVVFACDGMLIHVQNEMNFTYRSSSLDLEKGKWNEVIDIWTKYSKSDSITLSTNGSVEKYISYIFGEQPKIKIEKIENNHTKVYLWVPDNAPSGITIYWGLSVFENGTLSLNTNTMPYKIK